MSKMMMSELNSDLSKVSIYYRPNSGLQLSVLDFIKFTRILPPFLTLHHKGEGRKHSPAKGWGAESLEVIILYRCCLLRCI